MRVFVAGATDAVGSRTTGAFEGEGLVLRYGVFYGPETGMLDRSMIDQLRHRRVPLICEANGWRSFLHSDDAAAATAIAIERGAADFRLAAGLAVARAGSRAEIGELFRSARAES
jgi:nucleoside-diphosphate-sugar epimerase